MNMCQIFGRVFEVNDKISPKGVIQGLRNDTSKSIVVVVVVVVMVRWCGGLGVEPLGRPARARISARGLPTVRSEGRQITLKYCLNNTIKYRIQLDHSTRIYILPTLIL